MPAHKDLELFKLIKAMNSTLPSKINNTDYCERISTCKEEHQLMVDGTAAPSAYEFYDQIGQYCKPCRQHFEDLSALKGLVQHNILYIDPPESLKQHIAELIRKST